MRPFRILLVVLACVIASRGVVCAQTLADVARQEEERRKAIKKPSKVYTSADLRRDSRADTPTTVSAPSGPPASTPSSTPSSDTPGTPSTPAPAAPAAGGSKPAAEAPSQGAKDQAFWKGRINQAREQLERSKTLADAMQSRINALTTDFVNTDDPAKRSGLERDRQKALSELERLKKEIKDATKAISDIEEEARKANVPPGWLR